jgi:hypothetical protein
MARDRARNVVPLAAATEELRPRTKIEALEVSASDRVAREGCT